LQHDRTNFFQGQGLVAAWFEYGALATERATGVAAVGQVEDVDVGQDMVAPQDQRAPEVREQLPDEP